MQEVPFKVFVDYDVEDGYATNYRGVVVIGESFRIYEHPVDHDPGSNEYILDDTLEAFASKLHALLSALA